MAFVARCFVDDDITHVENRIDPISDPDIIETELMLADLESLEMRVVNVEKKAKGGDKDAQQTLRLISLATRGIRAKSCVWRPRRNSAHARPRKIGATIRAFMVGALAAISAGAHARYRKE